MLSAFVANTAQLALTTAPWLVLGLVCAACIKAWLPTRAVGRQLGGSGFGPVMTAALIGAPLPLCSCGVLPAAFGLRRAGASKASTVSFLVATPETGADSIALSYVLLGPFLTIVRPIAAILSGVFAGLLVGRATGETATVGAVDALAHDHHGHASHAHGDSDCDDAGGHAASDWTASPWQRLADALRYAFTDLIDDLAAWLLIGLLIAGLMITVIPPDMLSAWGSGLFAMLLMLIVSVPMYVCATASTPIAHAMLLAGVSPGTVLVFMLAGPATNIAGLALIRRELGTRTLVAYLGGVCGGGVLLGLLVDSFWAYLGFGALAGQIYKHTHNNALPLLVALPSLAALFIAGVRPLRRLIFTKDKPVAAVIALAYLAVMLLTGGLPEYRNYVRFEANGVLQLSPESITRVTVSADGTSAAFVRQSTDWVREGGATALAGPLSGSLDRAVKFMHTANPVRVFKPEDIADSGPAEFGLDDPRLSIELENADGVVLRADFGDDSYDGLMQYMRLKGDDDLYLMSGFVGKEWETVANGGPGDEAPARRALVPLPLDDVAAVEIFARSKSYRFERDATGAWLLHRHAPGDDPNMLHRADPAQSERIAQALATFGRTPIERSIGRGERVDAYGLADPETIIVLFTKDEARPPLSFTVGDLASDGLGRYLLMPDGGEIVTIPDAQLPDLIALAAGLEP